MKASTIGWILAGLLLIALLILLLKDGCNKHPEIAVSKGDSLQYWKNKAGEVASIKKTEQDFLEVSIENKNLLDSIAKLYNSKTKYIKEYVKVTEKGEVKIVNTEVPIVKYVDSNNCPRVLFQGFENPYYIVEAQIDVKGDSSYVKLETIDTLSVVWKTVKEGGLFNRRTFLQVDMQNANPYNHITGATVYRVPQKTNAWNKWIKPVLVGAASSFATYQLTKK
jgi:hypothetical protein